mmetsp:Transcript_12919/g.22056  ORF Transcript_12919/g.22056 Transcript_12919/m.22056 type:complete len:207 (+) Transcript_12919:438-1058(+)
MALRLFRLFLRVIVIKLGVVMATMVALFALGLTFLQVLLLKLLRHLQQLALRLVAHLVARVRLHFEHHGLAVALRRLDDLRVGRHLHRFQVELDDRLGHRLNHVVVAQRFDHAVGRVIPHLWLLRGLHALLLMIVLVRSDHHECNEKRRHQDAQDHIQQRHHTEKQQMSSFAFLRSMNTTGINHQSAKHSENNQWIKCQQHATSHC